MAMPEFTLRQLLEAGVHFGHHTRRWNPRMAPYLYGVRNQVHIIDLQQTVPLLDRALRAVRDVTAAGGRVLFVGTKRAAAEYVAEAAKRCGQYYVNHRWLGGTLTNWKTITGSIKRLRQIEEMLGGNIEGLTKKEVLEITRDQRQAGARAGRHQGDGRPAGHPVHHRHEQGEARGRGGEQAAHPGGRDPRQQLRPDRRDLSRCPATTMRSAPSRCTATWWPGAVLDGISAEMAASGQDIGAVENLPPEAMPEVGDRRPKHANA